MTLAEGPSEQVILPRLFGVIGTETDLASISVVPLGGRYVNHFWRLLNELGVPFATLLDLDLGREGAAWGRIKYVVLQLRAIGVPDSALLEFSAAGKTYSLTEAELSALHKKDFASSLPELRAWRDHLEQFGVFFSHPLDIDFQMLRHFFEAYQTAREEGTGPNIPKNADQRDEYFSDAIAAVASKESIPLYKSQNEIPLEIFPWYRYLFLQRSKPSTHIMALTAISPETLAANAPPVLKRLYAYCTSSLVPEAANGIAGSP